MLTTIIPLMLACTDADVQSTCLGFAGPPVETEEECIMSIMSGGMNFLAENNLTLKDLECVEFEAEA